MQTIKACKEEILVNYGIEDEDAKPLVVYMDIVESLEHIMRICKNLEQNHPEKSVNIQKVSCLNSRRALRANQEPANNKVQSLRTNYAAHSF